ncbi:membrane protein [Pueribacillus theae]|uniref:UPF0182 protein DCC39_09590 n=1 Tax=Pueribacillus theae TaxID=2171751 RepID=A0A2U1K1Z4_9BACI|nr:UPF0182 family protein [Pueribacillus theae]PWA11214.1 membrane protein [Pueribacillus theae]
MRFPQNTRKFISIGRTIGILIILLLLISIVANWWANYVWQEEVGFSSVFVTMFLTKIGLGIAGFLLFFISAMVLFFNIRATFIKELPTENRSFIIANRKLFAWLNIGVSFLIGLFGSLLVRGIGWERTLGYLNQEAFGVTDPYFGRDISFFVYTLPMWNFIIGVLLVMLGAILVIKLSFYSIYELIKHSQRAQRHFLSSVLLFGIVVALKYLLAPYERALSNSVNLFQDSVVVGVSFTDKYVNIPFDYIMAGVTLLATVLFVLAILRRKVSFVKLAVPLFVGAFILGNAASLVVQSFIVSPNELAKEEPFLANNIDLTRKAYELDKIKTEDMEINDSLTQEMLERNEDTIKNIRINDTRPLKEVYNQLQTFRPYYDFVDIDIDRYKIDGQYQQVFISTRELTQKNLPDRAQTWVNRNLRYTHGYGAAISNVNAITSEGQPEYIVKDLPPKGSIEITRPQIYFGENDYNSVIVNSKVNEFDFPDNEDSASNRYEADSGIQLNGLNRLLFAWNEKAYRYIISKQVTSESRLLQTRNIYDRVHRIAPFLEIEPDAYPVVRDDGTMVWMMDAFTKSDRYPYSDHNGHSFNYIRNPIKITVDAYTGEVVFYLIDPEEPIAKTYNKMFPDLFTTEVPKDIQEHFRYPVKLFETQSDLYRAYHMTNLELFYNREDYWQFPTEKYYGEDISMEPYYVTMKMDDADQEEFILMTPFTPNKKQNMSAWMGVRNDGEHYGEMFVYTFSKQRNIYGPQQIENRINQNDTISQELNLWSQGGSKVIRGNLLVIPIEDTLMYVEPMYIESNNETALPEVKRIIVSYQDYIVMEPTLDKALERLMGLIGDNVPPNEAEEQPDEEAPTPPQSLTPDGLLNEIQAAFEDYRKANQAGNYAEAGQALQKMEELLEQWRAKRDSKGKESNGD